GADLDQRKRLPQQRQQRQQRRAAPRLVGLRRAAAHQRRNRVAVRKQRVAEIAPAGRRAEQVAYGGKQKGGLLLVGREGAQEIQNLGIRRDAARNLRVER